MDFYWKFQCKANNLELENQSRRLENHASDRTISGSILGPEFGSICTDVGSCYQCPLSDTNCKL